MNPNHKAQETHHGPVPDKDPTTCDHNFVEIFEIITTHFVSKL